MKCDKLKSMTAVDAYEEYENNILDESRSYDVYNKQDVDEAIAELKAKLRKQKRKRCLAMARVCQVTAMFYSRLPFSFYDEKAFDKWKIRNKKWLEIAENFKE